ncbi:MAG: C39 family peptidase [Myxococcales bacterium]|nr:C39 family peptidase [Myxococcales bacterium]
MRTAAPRTALLALVLLAVGCRLSYTGGATTVKPHEVPAGWLTAAPTPVVVQTQRQDCGLAALAMIAGAWGRHWTLPDLTHRLPPGSKGVQLGKLRDLARERGLVAYAVKGSFDDLRTELAAGRPVLLGLVLPFDRSNNLHHYEVAVAMNPADGTVVTRDPATGDLRRRPREVLDLEWKHAGYATLVVVGTTDARVSMQENSRCAEAC